MDPGTPHCGIMRHRLYFGWARWVPVAPQGDVACGGKGLNPDITDQGDQVGLLVPGFLVTVNEDGVIWEVVVAVDDEGEINHCFVTFVFGDLEGDSGVGVVDVVGVGFPTIFLEEKI